MDMFGSLGTVSGNVEGNLVVDHPSSLAAPGNLSLRVIFDPIADESKIKTQLGGKLGSRIDLRIKPPILPAFNVGGRLADVDIALETDLDFDYMSKTTFLSMDSQKITGIGFDAIIAVADLELQMEQTVSFSLGAGGVVGLITATHLDSGFTRTTAFGAADAWVPWSVLLDRPGYWQIAFGDISLNSNRFSHRLDVNLVARLWALVLGDLGRLQAGVTVFQGTPFELIFDKVDSLGSFDVHVPEPGVLPLLLLAGVMARPLGLCQGI